ncbi:Early nodulin-like protein 1 [Apostasia shenzhenica]|uniref:Early nodulin-like protein 1 n=1 Tax=Apostasia shenzhenica TaxID=1088818 RepID=A0A2I0BFU2_9ASPA|nr:Early nodulin-like protein 1 [Apostasia shenzhenica]
MAAIHRNAFLLLTVALAFFLGASEAHKDHIVGGSFGWKIPPNATFYQEWAAAKTFVINQMLMANLRAVFLFRIGVENVLEVSAEDFEKCGNTNVIDMYYEGPTIVDLTSPGPHFFFSGVGLHCEEGQKLAINVTTTAPPPPYVADDWRYSLGSSAATANAAAAAAPSPSSDSAAGSVSGVAPAIALLGYAFHALFM